MPSTPARPDPLGGDLGTGSGNTWAFVRDQDHSTPVEQGGDRDGSPERTTQIVRRDDQVHQASSAGGPASEAPVPPESAGMDALTNLASAPGAAPSGDSGTVPPEGGWFEFSPAELEHASDSSRVDRASSESGEVDELGPRPHAPDSSWLDAPDPTGSGTSLGAEPRYGQGTPWSGSAPPVGSGTVGHSGVDRVGDTDSSGRPVDELGPLPGEYGQEAPAAQEPNRGESRRDPHTEVPVDSEFGMGASVSRSSHEATEAMPSASAAEGSSVPDEVSVDSPEVDREPESTDMASSRFAGGGGRDRRDPISEEFPGFEEPAPTAVERYPGYDHVEDVPETEPLATVTLSLGILSVVLLPLGLLLGGAALLIAPRARRRISAARGTLEGTRLVAAGTVCGLVGIVLWVLGVALGVTMFVL
ncbi:hypothetical protein RIF23_06600 [Lipingzhangella sp. LS1_29]|uniref:DUF4190 domain-containing protein n=1 Tax=Lipingzhangella rawalii TaxID=2055835 RepID=A0ABU2H3T3_9ACTN|nr:hypothetical protein [Lipingzhangella rawalii]MDS1269963.1 hypothetical protein [Lipingzhangella rawalii]